MGYLLPNLTPILYLRVLVDWACLVKKVPKKSSKLVLLVIGYVATYIKKALTLSILQIAAFRLLVN